MTFREKILKRFPEAELREGHIYIPFLEAFEYFRDIGKKHKFKRPRDGKTGEER
jgi:hypothetical protein